LGQETTNQGPTAPTTDNTKAPDDGRRTSERSRKRKLAQRAEEEGEEEEACPICLDQFAPGDKLKQLPCQHEFHHDCLKTWVNMDAGNGACPFCRQCINCGVPKFKVVMKFFDRIPLFTYDDDDGFYNPLFYLNN